ncbi:MAG TPA: hypothetical protein VFG73_03255 [Rhodanobacteraceae bacterium]|nr:hypothetical protein [Rhodanobacteraceae bacterium]
MALKLFAVLIVLAAMALAPHWLRYRHWRIYDAWLRQLQGSSGLAWLLLAVLVPTMVVSLVSVALYGVAFGLLSLLFAIAVLGFCLRDVGPEVDAVLAAGTRETRAEAAAALYVDAETPEDPLDPDTLVEAVMVAALRRRFGVLFWFFLLGPGGAVLYHLGVRATADATAHDVHEARHMGTRLAAVLDWIPAHLMALSIALASNFDAVVHAWRAWHGAAQRVAWEFGAGFLGAVARAGVRADIEDEGEVLVDGSNAACNQLADARHLLTRVLVLWLCAAAIIVLAGWVV